MSFGGSHDVGGRIDTARAFDDTSLTAGGAGDNTEIVGATIDRTAEGTSGKSLALSAVLSIGWQATQANTNTLTFKTVKLQHGAKSDASDMADLVTVAPDVVADTGTGTTDKGRTKYSFDLAQCKQYIRFKVTPDLSAANTDTAKVAGQVILGGLDILP